MAKSAGAFLKGGYKGSNSKAIYPKGKSFGSPSTGALDKKISAKQSGTKTGFIAGKGGNKFIPAKSEAARDADIHAASKHMLDVHYK